jgi:predicted transcriptional regulator
MTLVRTQISLTNEQYDALRRIASRRGVSMSMVVRDAIDEIVDRDAAAARWQRALAVIGTGRSGLPDLAENHDEYLAEAFVDWRSS